MIDYTGVVIRFFAVFALCWSSTFAADEFEELLRWLPGHYDTTAQAEADATRKAAYRHVSAELRIVRLSDGVMGFSPPNAVFYLEQSLAGQTAQPYRQRILVFERTSPDLATLWDYKISDPKDLVGAGPERFRELSASRLSREGGCEVTWVRADRELYKGSTGSGRACKSTLRGATHVISYSELTPRILISLDQGFDDSGAHKWGPPPGGIGHIFRKRAAGASLEAR